MDIGRFNAMGQVMDQAPAKKDLVKISETCEAMGKLLGYVPTLSGDLDVVLGSLLSTYATLASNTGNGALCAAYMRQVADRLDLADATSKQATRH